MHGVVGTNALHVVLVVVCLDYQQGGRYNDRYRHDDSRGGGCTSAFFFR